MDKLLHSTLNYGCNYLSMLGLTLNHVSERGRRWYRSTWLKGEWYRTITKHNTERIMYMILGINCVDLILTYWGRYKMADISQTILSNVFSATNTLEFRLKFHWSLFPWVKKITALFQIMAWRHPSNKPLSESMLVTLPIIIHICVTRSQWLKNIFTTTFH